MSKTGDPPNPEAQILEHQSRGFAATHRFLTEKLEDLQEMVRKLVIKHRNCLPSKIASQTLDTANEVLSLIHI